MHFASAVLRKLHGFLNHTSLACKFHQVDRFTLVRLMQFGARATGEFHFLIPFAVCWLNNPCPKEIYWQLAVGQWTMFFFVHYVKLIRVVVKCAQSHEAWSIHWLNQLSNKPLGTLCFLNILPRVSFWFYPCFLGVNSSVLIGKCVFLHFY